MKTNFDEMSTKELTTYVLKHRNDLEAIDILVSRRSPDEEATWYEAMTTSDGEPIEENIVLAQEAIRQRVQSIENKKSS